MLLQPDVSGMMSPIEALIALVVLSLGPLALGALGGWVGGWLLRRDKASSALWTGVRIGCLVFVLCVVFYWMTLQYDWDLGPGRKRLIGSYCIFLFLAFLFGTVYTFCTRRPKPASR